MHDSVTIHRVSPRGARMPPKKTRASSAAPKSAKRQRRPANAPAAAPAAIMPPAPFPASHSDLTGSATLPTDIIQLVLGFVPLRPRLLVAAMVCRRWSEAARRATTALPGHLKLTAYHTACQRLPVVTSLCVTQPLPSDDSFRAVAQLSALTSLTIRTDHSSPANMLAQLLAQNGKSLTTLGVRLFSCTRSQVAALADAELPALRTLHMQWPLWELIDTDTGTAIAALLAKLSPQLRSLSLISKDPIALPEAFPQLKHYFTNNLFLPPPIEPLLARAPQLGSISYHATSRISAALLPRVSHLRLLGSWQIPLLKQVVALSTLTSLEVDDAHRLFTQTAWQFKHIRSLQVSSFRSRYDLFYHFPHLTSFSLTSNIDAHLSALVDLLRAFVVSKAPLRYLHFRILEDQQLAPRDAFKALLPRVEERGLECLHVYVSASHVRSQQSLLCALQEIAKKRLWLDVLVEATTFEKGRCTCAH